MRPVFAPEQEVRFAVVMYGGVSLAIYINGVAQELFRLVRATAPARQYAASREAELAETEAEERPEEAFYADEDLDPTERVYRRLGRTLGLEEPAAGDGRIRTRFVVDIIAGTSAGGINGVLLGLALARQRDFRRSSELWRKVADIDRLLREEKSYDGLPPDTPRDSESLLNGYRLYFKARDAMDDMPEETPRDLWRPAFVEQLDLAVTATDLLGVPLPIRLSEQRSIDERVYRKVFRFSHGTRPTTGELHSDFDHLDLMLGFAARATSSFPMAFEPVLLRDLRLLTRPGKPSDPDLPLSRFFADDIRRGRDPEAIPYADGGYLDNKPFSHATAALRTRRADVPVVRKLVYIEPHPIREAAKSLEQKDKRGRFRTRPDIVANVADSMSLPRHETIREDVAAVAARNLAVERLQELGLQAERTLDAIDPLDKLRDGGAADDAAADELLERVGPVYAAYRGLRVRSVLDELAVLGAKLRAPRPGEDRVDAEIDVGTEIRNALRAWIEAQERGTQGAFLDAFDVSYRQRRLSYLHDRINDLLRGRTRAARMLAVAQKLGMEGAPRVDADAILAAAGEVALAAEPAAALAGQGDALRDLKVALNAAVDRLRRAERAPDAYDLSNTLLPAERTLFDAVTRAAQPLPQRSDDYMGAVRSFLERPLAAADAGITDAIASATDLAEWVRGLLDEYDRRFAAYDMVVLPLAYPELGETNSVGIVRISPFDAPRIAPEDPDIGGEHGDPSRKLAGIRFGHFGGFLDEGWRDNDVMWGRLDAAEVILDTFADPAQRDELREQAQAAILRQELRGALRAALEKDLGSLDAVPDPRLVAEFRARFRPPADLAPAALDGLTARAVRIGGGVLREAAYGRKWPTWPFRAASLIGPGAARVGLPVSRGWKKVKAAPKRVATFVRDHVPFRRRG
jgi:patatin-related protein